jgi:excisionase family DNA binding protein
MLLRGFATPLLRNARSGSVAPPGEFLTVREAARVLKVSKATVYRLCAREELGHVRVLNSIRIPAGAVARLGEASARGGG